MMSHVEPTALGYCYYSNAQSRKLSNLMEKVNIRKQNHRDYLLLGILAYAPYLHYSVLGYFPYTYVVRFMNFIISEIEF